LNSLIILITADSLSEERYGIPLCYIEEWVTKTGLFQEKNEFPILEFKVGKNK
jgi:hypothetical protein